MRWGFSIRNLEEKVKSPEKRLGDRIEELLKDEALPVCAIRKVLEESGGKEINRRALWRKIKKLERWDRIKKVTARKVSYYKGVEEQEMNQNPLFFNIEDFFFKN